MEEQRPDMTLAVDCDIKHQFKQTNKRLVIIEFVTLSLIKIFLF